MCDIFRIGMAGVWLESERGSFTFDQCCPCRGLWQKLCIFHDIRKLKAIIFRIVNLKFMIF